MPFGPDPKKPHAVCIHGAGGGSHSLPDNFPLDQFIKKATCTKNKESKQYDCYFDYDPASFNERSGTYQHWDGSVLLYLLLAAIVIVIFGFALVYLFCLKGAGGGGHGGGHGSGGHGGGISGILGNHHKSNKSSKHSSKPGSGKKSKSGKSSCPVGKGSSVLKSPKSKSKKSGKGEKSSKKSGKK